MWAPGKIKKEENRENNEHLVPRQFTPNRNEQIDTPPKHGEVWLQQRQLHVWRTKTTIQIQNKIRHGIAPSFRVNHVMSEFYFVEEI